MERRPAHHSLRWASLRRTPAPRGAPSGDFWPRAALSGTAGANPIGGGGRRPASASSSRPVVVPAGGAPGPPGAVAAGHDSGRRSRSTSRAPREAPLLSGMHGIYSYSGAELGRIDRCRGDGIISIGNGCPIKIWPEFASGRAGLCRQRVQGMAQRASAIVFGRPCRVGPPVQESFLGRHVRAEWL